MAKEDMLALRKTVAYLADSPASPIDNFCASPYSFEWSIDSDGHLNPHGHNPLAVLTDSD